MASSFPNNVWEDLVVKEFIPAEKPLGETTYSEFLTGYVYYCHWPKQLQKDAAYYISHVSNSLRLISHTLSASQFRIFVQAVQRTNHYFLGE